RRAPAAALPVPSPAVLSGFRPERVRRGPAPACPRRPLLLQGPPPPPPCLLLAGPGSRLRERQELRPHPPRRARHHRVPLVLRPRARPPPPRARDRRPGLRRARGGRLPVRARGADTA